MKRIILLLAAYLPFVLCAKPDGHDTKIDRLIGQMTLQEKIDMLHGNSMFSSGGVARLGIPQMNYSDGPHGVRHEVEAGGWNPANWTNDASSYLPALTALASTWDRALSREYGRVLGSECRARGKNVSLAPGVNIHRSLLNGRNWEYFSEDPYLSGELAVPYIQGVQSQGVASCVKHFALNSQAYKQYVVSSEVDLRTLNEIYLPAFEAAIQRAGVMTVMAAYNKVHGEWCCENSYLLQDILRKQLGFRGLVVSDWNAVHSTVPTAMAGLDVEMGTEIKKDGKYDFDNYYMGRPLLDKVQSGEVPISVIDGKIRNILSVMFRLDMIGKPAYDTTGMAAKLATPEHASVARKVAEESVVLLKNRDNALPLNVAGLKKVAVIGANANELFSLGGGSTKLKAKYEITPLEGIRRYLGKDVEIVYAPAYKLAQKTKPVGFWFTDEFNYFDRKLCEQAVALARSADVVIFVGGLNHENGQDCEGYDKPDIKLPYAQDQIIAELLKANPRTIVTLMCGGPVELGSWYVSAPALLQFSFIGMECGNALARVLFGDVNPSGKLTTTWPKRLEDMPDHVYGEYPGVRDTVRFMEGLMVGYRYFDTKGVEPMFPFGYGLSYTMFDYSDIRVSPAKNGAKNSFIIEFTVRNCGQRRGSEIAQLYVHQHKPLLIRPEKELKGFAKVDLEAGESRRIGLEVNPRAFQYFDPSVNCWTLDSDKFDILVGASSRDIKLKKTIEVTK